MFMIRENFRDKKELFVSNDGRKEDGTCFREVIKKL